NYYRMVRPEVGPSIAEMLERCGYHFNATQKFVKSLKESYKGRNPVSSVVYATAGDSSPSMEKFDKRLAELMEEQSWKSENPNISMGVHVWIHNKKGWDDLDKIFAKVANNPNWWYSNQTDYAAYRKILRLHKLEIISKTPNKVTYRLKLPYASDIGSNVPFTLLIDQPLEKVQINGTDVELNRYKNKTIFDIQAQPKAKCPTLIHYFENPDNLVMESVPVSQESPALVANLRVLDGVKKAHKLELQLKVKSPEITQIRVKYLLPLMYNNLKSDQMASLPEGPFSLDRELLLHPEEVYHWGQPYLLCQVDYLNGGKAERVFASCFGRKQLPPIQSGFRDGSLVSSVFQLTDKIKQDLLVMTSADAPLLKELSWSGATEHERLHYNEATAVILERLGLEQIKRAMESDSKSFYAILWTLDNPKGKKYLIARNNSNTVATFANGQELTGSAKVKIPLLKGENKILLLLPINAMTYKQKKTFSLILKY
ncbi:MAG: hypothetical protein NE328_09595, partial [Lentisphaeraceae bacterium]|nr:hypothetical protein [Lentisphaeraceae bacterium]